MFGSGTGEPAGDVPAQRTRTTGDQHRAARRPRTADAASGMGEPGGEHAGGADGDLVLLDLRSVGSL
ncbi:hypothetical protein ACWKT5_34415, partial [Streptomyces avermitilis]